MESLHNLQKTFNKKRLLIFNFSLQQNFKMYVETDALLLPRSYHNGPFVCNCK